MNVTITPDTIGELLGDHDRADIVCMDRGKVVRRLRREGPAIVASGAGVRTTPVRFEGSARLLLQPWVDDRGSIMVEDPAFAGAAFPHYLKLCCERDILARTDAEGRESRASIGAPAGHLEPARQALLF